MNLALSHLAISKKIVLETDRSAEANACGDFYNTVRDKVLSDSPWPFATKFALLGLVQNNPTTEWLYSYRYPSDCLTMRRIFSGIRNDNRQSRIPYKIGRDDQGLLIYTDMTQAEVEYTISTDDVTRYPEDFRMALSFLLAVYIAPRLTQGDPFKMGQRAFQMYQMEMGRAASAALDEQQDEEQPQSEFMRSRNEDFPGALNRFGST
jgi:hypothetical protein